MSMCTHVFSLSEYTPVKTDVKTNTYLLNMFDVINYAHLKIHVVNQNTATWGKDVYEGNISENYMRIITKLCKTKLITPVIT